MRTPQEAIQAVLTGDLVESTLASPRAVNKSMELLAGVAAEVATWQVGENSTVGETHFTRFRGDGWQILVSASIYALRAALLTHATLAAKSGLPNTRIAVGLSTVDNISGPDLSDAYGEAFAVSGRALLRMSRGENLRLAGHGITPLHAAYIALLDDRLSDWSAEQAMAVALVLPPNAPTQTKIAEDLGISPQALSYRLAGAKWPTIRRILNAWEAPAPPGGSKL